MNDVVTLSPSIPFELDQLPDDRRVGAAERARRMVRPGFGRVMTEHMVSIRWSAERGWHDARLTPYGPLTFDPAAVGLHYGQVVFEGLKAYALPDGGVGVFRPDAAARRLASSAERLAMPVLPEAVFLDAVDALVRADREWVPRDVGASLYLRPLMIATEPMLDLRPGEEYLFFVLAFVTDNFFGAEARALTVWVCEDYVRAAPGGTGAAKYAGNYAGTLPAQQQAAEHGCDQVVWLDAVERRWVEEAGGMNLFFVFGPEDDPLVSTPPLTGTLLPGVTRDSLLRLALELGYRTAEEPISVQQWRAACADGTLLESFACGTGAVVRAIGRVRSAGGEWTVGAGARGPVTARLEAALLDAQHGVRPDTRGWIHPVD